MLVDGVDEPYDMDQLRRMYSYLDKHGELYFIEVLEGDRYIPVGDVTFSEGICLLLSGRNHTDAGIGKKVVMALIERGKQLGYTSLEVREIFKFNTGSQKLFESVGFQRYEETDKGYRYRLNLVKEG